MINKKTIETTWEYDGKGNIIKKVITETIETTEKNNKVYPLNYPYEHIWSGTHYPQNVKITCNENT